MNESIVRDLIGHGDCHLIDTSNYGGWIPSLQSQFFVTVQGRKDHAIFKKQGRIRTSLDKVIQKSILEDVVIVR